jgi:hypothetical protein
LPWGASGCGGGKFDGSAVASGVAIVGSSETVGSDVAPGDEAVAAVCGGAVCTTTARVGGMVAVPTAVRVGIGVIVASGVFVETNVG